MLLSKTTVYIKAEVSSWNYTGCISYFHTSFFLFKLNNHIVLDFNLISSYSWTFVQTVVLCSYKSILHCFHKWETLLVVFVIPWAHVHTARLCGCLQRVRFPNKWIIFFSFKSEFLHLFIFTYPAHIHPTGLDTNSQMPNMLMLLWTQSLEYSMGKGCLI